MAVLTYLQINQNQYKFDRIMELKVTRRINEHSKLYLTAILDEGEDSNCVESTAPGSFIKLMNLQTENPFFIGLIEMITLKSQRNLRILEIEASSTTAKLDYKKMKRVYQKTDFSYHDITMDIAEKYSGDCIDTVTNNASIEKLYLQYNETDWEFLKRLASHFHTGLVVNDKAENPTFTFGIPEGIDRGSLERFHFYIKKDIAAYEMIKENTNQEISDLDMVSFFIQTSQEFQIGDKVTYQEIKNLYIKECHLEMADGVIQYQYELCPQNGLKQTLFWNEHLAGISVKGKVKKVEKDKVAVQFEDGFEENESSWLFPYTTLYTAEEKAGWYWMPELDDTVFIYFPDQEESNAIAINSIRQSDKENSLIQDPDIKLFRTKNGKELRFSPDEIVIVCCNENGHTTYIRLHQENGIELASTEKIRIMAEDSISLEAGKKLEISAKNEIQLKCGSGALKLTDQVSIAGSEIKIN